MINKNYLKKSILFILLLFVSCDKEVSVSEPQTYETGKAKIFISTTPAKATIYVDDKNFGLTTPDTVKWLSEGEHKFTLKLEPFLDFTFNAIVKNESVTIENYNYYTDYRNFGSIKFSSKPDSCTIYFNDSLLSFKTPYTITNLIPATYKVKYSYPEHRSDSTNIFVYAGKQSLVHMNLADTTVWVTYNKDNSFIPDNTINDIMFDDNNKMWIATWHSGIVTNRTGAWENLLKENSNLPGNIVHRLKKDKLNNIWAATYFGLAKITKNNIIQFTTLNSKIPDNYVSDLDFDDLQNIWVGTQKGVSKFDGFESWTTYKTSSSSIPADFITAVEIDLNNNLWIGTNNFNTITFDGLSNWTSYQSDTSPIGDSVNDLLFDINNVLWIGLTTDLKSGKYGGVYVLENNSMKEIDLGLSNKYINKFYYDDANTMWIGTRGGLIEAKSVDNYKLYTSSNSKLPINDILCIAKDNAGNMWFGTNGRGLIKYKIWKDN